MTKPEPVANPGQTVDLRRTSPGESSRKTLLIRTKDVEVILLEVPAGEGVPLHEAQGELILHCLKGRISVSTLGRTHELVAEQLLYLRSNEPFSIRGIEDALLLATFVAAKAGGNVEVIGA